MGAFAQAVGGSFGQALGSLHNFLGTGMPQDEDEYWSDIQPWEDPLPDRRGLAQRGASWELPSWGDDLPPGTIPGDMPPGAATPFGSLGSFLELLGGPGGAGAGGPSAAGSSGGYAGSSGFTARPPGRDFGGYDVTPDDLISRQGITGVPAAIRTLLAAERRLGVPGLSEAVSGEGYRSHEQQAALYRAHLAGQHPAPVAPPGQSYHEQGEAFDIGSSWLAANPRVRPWLERHGFTWDVPGEPWHAHYTGGGQPLQRPVTARGNQGRRIPVTTPRTRHQAPAPFVSNRPMRY